MSTSLLAAAQPAKWVTVWAASAHGPYPVGNPSAQPNQRFAFPVPADGARDQTFRLIVRPDVWGPETRLRFSNVFGTRPLELDDVHVGVQLSGAAIVRGTNRPVTFHGQPRIVIPAGQDLWSDAVAIGAQAGALDGRKLAVSFHVGAQSGPMTWHAKALTTSYLTPQGAGRFGSAEEETPFSLTTTSWFFLDAVDMRLPASTKVVVAFGDSITDGTASTLNGDDRWPDVLSRRLHRAYGTRVAVVNAGIGGNQVAGPATYSAASPIAGGPAAGQRLERDVLSLSGVATVIWLEGINDFGNGVDASVETVSSAMRAIVARMRERVPGVTVVGATVTSALHSTNGAHGSAGEDQKRRALNTFIRTSGVFDAVADFDAATLDPATGELQAMFVPESTTGGAGDKLHPNHAGYMAMAQAIDLTKLGLGAPER
ncbi:MAG TPA: GDSL-type esterase/lipase family protein [Vicinamibacterales bacterium]|nr:GDSL-type esterase/lipase family protein [Vicinamibacterales bacterium]